MLTIVTGAPGNGKTLHTIQTIEAQRKLTAQEVNPDGSPKYPGGRLVFQLGIKILDHAALPWLDVPLQASGYNAKAITEKGRPEMVSDWAQIPVGGMIVIDEAWKYFPVRGPSDGVLPYVQFFAEHRHQGLDIWLITQHVQQIDTFVRKMCQRHVYLERKWGSESAEVFQWEQLSDVKSTKAREKAIRTSWSFPKEIYAWYESADMHTVKKDFPWRKFWFIPFLVVGVVALFYFAVVRVLHMRDAGKPKDEAGHVVARGEVANLAPWWKDKSAIARIPALPGSAPRYDQVYRIVSVPHVSGCMSMQRGLALDCKCTNEGGEVLPLTVAECSRLIHDGWFDPSRSYPDAKKLDVEFLEKSAGKMAPLVQVESERGVREAPREMSAAAPIASGVAPAAPEKTAERDSAAPAPSRSPPVK